MSNVTLNIGTLSSSQCWDFLKQNSSNSYLIDVRSEEEWVETGVADLSSINKQVTLLSWLIPTPYIHVNDKFIDIINEIIKDKNANLFFICKSGGRSAKAAQAAAQDGYTNCYNVNDGFIGNMFDDNLQDLSLNGWVNSNLPRRKL